jgi:hypothetical protein
VKVKRMKRQEQRVDMELKKPTSKFSYRTAFTGCTINMIMRG